ncbi:MAG: cytochrome c [Ignavibacteria bacterium]|nr:cytochrome c [Ignavibacteria bacterium]
MKTSIHISAIALLMFTAAAFVSGCGDDPSKGIGPVKEVKLDATVNEEMSNKGKAIFEQKCVSCHKWNEKLVGPALSGVTKRRKPEWIMNMILNPVEMTQKNPEAQALYNQLLVQMTFQDVTQDDARSILEYFRSMDK